MFLGFCCEAGFLLASPVLLGFCCDAGFFFFFNMGFFFRWDFRGTPLYMSPESVNHNEYESPADIWAC